MLSFLNVFLLNKSTEMILFVRFFASPKKEPKKGAFYEGVF